MPDVRTMFDKEFLYHYDLQGQEATVTIDRVSAGAVQGTDGKKKKKPIVFFKGKQKGLAINITNARTIAGMYGLKTEAWTGKRITIFPTTCQFGGKTVECIRVKPNVPGTRGADTELPEAPAIEREPGSDDDHEAVT